MLAPLVSYTGSESLFFQLHSFPSNGSEMILLDRLEKEKKRKEKGKGSVYFYWFKLIIITSPLKTLNE